MRTRRGRAAAALGAALAATLAGCSWGGQEPGLFTTPTPAVTPAPTPDEPRSGRAPGATLPGLPVLGDALWISADGNGVVLRLAVHAVRRGAGVTALDWSVTPLAGPGRRAGDLVPSGTDLGLTRSLAGEQSLALLDTGAGRAYRPLVDLERPRSRPCLCTPLAVVTPQLRFGETTLLQLAFPPLPERSTRVDVLLPNVAVVPGVPVSPPGLAPVSAVAPDLARPPAAGNPATGAKTYQAPGAEGRRQTVVVNQVVAARGLTSVVWTLRSVTDQPGLGARPGPPLSTPPPAGVRVVTDDPASGPRLRVPGRATAVGARWTTASPAGRAAYECLCSGLGVWSRGLRHDGGTAHLATHVGPLPSGTRRVDVVFPGLPAFTDVPVTWRPDVAGRARSLDATAGATWTVDESDPPRGWTPGEWPTPVPAEAQLARYASRPERILASLPGS